MIHVQIDEGRKPEEIIYPCLMVNQYGTVIKGVEP